MGFFDFLLTRTAVINPYTGDIDNEPSYGPPEVRSCRIETSEILDNNFYADGTLENRKAKATLYCEGKPIPTRSIVRVDGQEYTVLSCAVITGFYDHHLEVELI